MRTQITAASKGRLLLAALALAMTLSVFLASHAFAGTLFDNWEDSALKINDADEADNPGTASSYPSYRGVTLMGKPTITDVNVKLYGFSHPYPDDVDVMVVGPRGQSAIVMSDVGGGNPGITDDVDLTLDDEAEVGWLPDRGPLASGKYKPTNAAGNDGSRDTFPSPAPTPSGNTALSAFDGTNPNGTWKLYVVDDEHVDTGWFGTLDSSGRAWGLDITVKAQISKVLDAIFAGYDHNKNGVINLRTSSPGDPTKDERVRLTNDGRLVSMDRLFYDSNGNGDRIASRTEIRGVISGFDKNKDGRLGGREYTSFNRNYGELVFF